MSVVEVSGAGVNTDWWRSAVTYQIYLRSFADSNGDGLGDVAGIRSRLSYLVALGVDAIWINPWYPSPQADGGYDVADYRNIDPAFGDLAGAQQLIDEAHALGLRVILDIVPNHTSDEHPWFAAALAAGPGSPERRRYLFRPGRGSAGEQPPNNWRSVFGGSAWTRVTEADGQAGEWYLHLFDVRQPDLNWAEAEVRDEFEDVLRFWFDRGADGFRIDVAHGLAKDPLLPDLNLPDGVVEVPLEHVHLANHPYWDRAQVQEIYQSWRAVADGYQPPRVFVAEAWVASADRLAEYLRPGRLHTAFDFDFVRAPWRAKDLRESAASSLRAHQRVGAPVMWVLSNHDLVRHVTRYGRRQHFDGENPIHGGEHEGGEQVGGDQVGGDQVDGEQVDGEQVGGEQVGGEQGGTDVALGTRRARAAIALMLALPGGVYLYQGEELGLPEVEDLPDDLLQDPTWERSGHTVRGRDGCRVPMPWTTTGPSFGFGSGPGWLPQPKDFSQLSVEAALQDDDSMLALYRTALRVRRELPQLVGGAKLTWTGEEVDVLEFTRGEGFVCIVNTGSVPVPLPPGAVVLSSEPIVNERLPQDATAWIVFEVPEGT